MGWVEQRAKKKMNFTGKKLDLRGEISRSETTK